MSGRTGRGSTRTGWRGDVAFPSIDQNLEYQILTRLEEATDSVGSGGLYLSLREEKVAVSPATIGRVLRLLDHERLTAKVSNRGRVLTPAGRQFLAELRRRQSRKERAEKILGQMEPAKREEFRKVLDALRMIESLMARLAAENATPEQIRGMEEALEAQRRTIEAPGQGAEQGELFHRRVLEACGNRFLLAAGSFIWSNNEMLRALWFQANDLTGHSSYSEHTRILDAIVKRQPLQAQKAMEAHFRVFGEALNGRLQRDRESQATPTPA